MKRYAVLALGTFAYALFFPTFLYWFGFLINVGVPRGLDSAPTMHWLPSLAIDLVLIGIFGLQHTIMARPRFKNRWTRIVSPVSERSVYVIASCVALALLFWQWQPLGGTLWNVENAYGKGLIYALFGLGLLTIFASSLLINHFDLFGVRQVWLYFRGKPYTYLPFKTPGFYRYVRHPLYVGWLLSLWATPHMTITHFVFAAGFTAYILIAIPHEERDLVAHHGESYAQYRRSVPMLLPRFRKVVRRSIPGAGDALAGQEP